MRSAYRRSSFGAPFTPASVSGLQAWYDASAIVGKVDGDAMSSWTDRSGNGLHLVQATGAKQPLYKLGIINSLPAVRFDGTDDLMSVAAGFNDLSSYAVLVPRRTAASTEAIYTYKFGMYQRLNNFWGVFDNGFARESTVNPLTDTTYLLARRLTAGVTVKFQTNTTTSTSAVGVPGSKTSITVGGDPAPAQLAKFDLAELIMYNTDVSDADDLLVRTYIQSKYAFTVV